MKRTFAFLLTAVILFTFAIPCFANTDKMARFEDFLKKQGKSGMYTSALKGGEGSFSMHINSDGDISCSLVQYKTVEDPVDGNYREGFDFTITVNKNFDGNYKWACGTEDANGVTKTKGVMAAGENMNSDLTVTEYDGDEYIKNSVIKNIKTFRNDLVRAIANDLNYYLDENLTFFGFDATYLCPTGHTFGEWVYQQNAKLNVNGTEKRTCTVCFCTEEREKEGSMITPQPAPETQTEQQTQTQTQTQTSETPTATTEPAAPSGEQTPEESDPLTPTPSEPTVDPEVDYDSLLDNEDDSDDGGTKKSTLPGYVIPLVIGIAAVIAAGVSIFFVVSKRKRSNDDDADSDTFEASDDDFDSF